MSVVIPADLALFVRRLIAEGRFLTESDVIAEGLRLLRSQESLRTAVRKGFDELDFGKGVAADQVFAKAEQRIASVQRAERA
jgi:putative addiction module CopG family antidote